MKSLFQIIVAVALAAPVISFAQQANTPVTREQVRQELAQLVKAGYNPAKRDIGKYPADLQAAQASIAAQHGTAGGATPDAPK
jgi:hypothetical protein